MRAIDGDELRKQFPEPKDWSDPEQALVHITGIWAEIDNATTIEPERKTGEWIPSFNGRFTGGAYWFHCSKCERIVPDVRNGGWNFCPNCGSKNGG